MLCNLFVNLKPEASRPLATEHLENQQQGEDMEDSLLMKLKDCLIELSDCTMDIIDNHSNPCTGISSDPTNTNSEKNENKMIGKYWDFVNIIKLVNEQI